jgi:hypothetical protein
MTYTEEAALYERRARARFWKKVEITKDCWIWMGEKSEKGYGYFLFRGKKVRAHRLVYEWLFGIISDSLSICHHCDTPACVNPGHLFAGTNLDNIRDAQRKGRYGQDKMSPGAKLTKGQIEEIKRLYAVGNISQRQLARDYGTSQSNIGRIVRKEIWTWVE